MFVSFTAAGGKLGIILHHSPHHPVSEQIQKLDASILDCARGMIYDRKVQLNIGFSCRQ